MSSLSVTNYWIIYFQKILFHFAYFLVHLTPQCQHERKIRDKGQGDIYHRLERCITLSWRPISNGRLWFCLACHCKRHSLLAAFPYAMVIRAFEVWPPMLEGLSLLPIPDIQITALPAILMDFQINDNFFGYLCYWSNGSDCWTPIHCLTGYDCILKTKAQKEQSSDTCIIMIFSWHIFVYKYIYMLLDFTHLRKIFVEITINRPPWNFR